MINTMLEMLIEIPRQLANSTEETAETLAAAQAYLVAVMDAADGEQRIVASIARRYLGRGLSFIELIHYGNQGLEAYDKQGSVAQSLKDQTLMHGWIKKAIGDAVADRPLRLKHLIETQQQLTTEFVRTPTDEELALEMGILPPEHAVKVYMAWQGGPALPPIIAQELQAATSSVANLRYLLKYPTALIEHQ